MARRSDFARDSIAEGLLMSESKLSCSVEVPTPYAHVVRIGLKALLLRQIKGKGLICPVLTISSK